MIYPSINKLLNIVDSKYALVHIIAQRSRQMETYHNYQLNENCYHSKKSIGRAMEELEQGLIKVKK